MAGGMRLDDAIDAVLRERGPMSCRDIADQIRTKNMARLGGKTPDATVSATISRAPERFVRIRSGIYGVKDGTKPDPRNTDQNSHDASYRSIEYQYTERFIDMPDGGYHRISIDGVVKMITGEKSFVLKKLNSEFPNLTKDNFPCVYVLGVDIPQREAYIGESYEVLVRMKHWEKNKDYKYAAIFHTKELNTDNIRLNIERVLMESFEDAGWKLQNKKKATREISQTDEYTYEQIEKFIPIVAEKIKCVFTMYDNSHKTNIKPKGKTAKQPKKQNRKPATWQGSLNRADTTLRTLVRHVINTLQNDVGGIPFESAWLYFGDEEASRKNAFVALAIGKKWLDLVFLSPKNSSLPRNTRTLKPFVLPRQSEYRLRLNKTNLDTIAEIAIKSRDYMRSLDKKKKQLTL